MKPANLGSSVGISKAHDRKELGPALDQAAKYDRKLVVEQGVGGKKSRARELEVGVLGNDDPKASVVGEIIPGKEFYDYEAKYLSEGSVPVIPGKAHRAPKRSRSARWRSPRFAPAILPGLARVDFLMEPDGKRRIYLNEVNTLPGFTQISMYPKLWEATGIPYSDLITRLIELALERHQEKNRNTLQQGIASREQGPEEQAGNTSTGNSRTSCWCLRMKEELVVRNRTHTVVAGRIHVVTPYSLFPTPFRALSLTARKVCDDPARCSEV